MTERISPDDISFELYVRIDRRFVGSRVTDHMKDEIRVEGFAYLNNLIAQGEIVDATLVCQPTNTGFRLIGDVRYCGMESFVPLSTIEFRHG